MKLQIDFNKDDTHQIEEKNFEVKINNEVQLFQIYQLSEFEFLLINNHQVFNISLLNSNGDETSIKINNTFINYSSQNYLLAALKEFNLKSSQNQKTKEIISPMPGTIIEINVNVGDVVRKGQTLIILEAMKMENVIKSPCDAKITNIYPIVGQTVEKNQVILSF